ncbi:DUF2642 domain-containing protein [Sporosarcina sp. YIM B06819]|uniref:DUF2642 domain-containing protein n=1 Tax=Sporosarcina sp. YIM B06819 TaxID=3081769 RepID=UPI00298CB80A|nr:DUF2642 domain-containing protein [Sporosarcina sp. YIM B06819]
MNNIIRSLVKQVVQLEVSGKNILKGTVIDLGTDTMVLFNGAEFVYIPLDHIQNFKVDGNNDEDIQAPAMLPSISADENDVDLTFTKVLTQAQGKYVEIYVTGNEALHGYITSIKDNYFEFQSPVYKTMYISLSHVKWLIPYAQNELAYGLNLPVQPNNETLASTFEVQVEQFKNEIVVLNIGGPKSHIGKITNVEQQIAEIQTARADSSYVNLGHIKTLHVV